MEGLGQILDELAEVHTLVGDVIEDGLVSVALILHVADLHVESETFGDDAALDHRGMFAGFRFTEFLHIRLTGDTVNALDIVGRFQVGLLDLQLYQTTCQGHHADVVARTGLHGYDVAFLQVQVIHVVVIALTSVLELYLHQVGVFGIARYVCQPVIGI